MRKKRVLLHSNSCRAKTGFGRHLKAVLKYLYSTGKYEIIEYATGVSYSDPSLKKMPWTTRGSLPDTQQEWNNILAGMSPQDQEMKKREVNYGSYNIDRAIKEFKPDVYIGIEDVWAIKPLVEKPWWNKITCCMHTTLDSLPILPDAVGVAKDVRNYWVWAKFAEDAMHELGYDHVETVHGAIETDFFYPKSREEKLALRKQHGIPDDAFVIGFVFRNQLRKSVVNILQGFRRFLDKNPNSNAYLLFHTNYNEGWNICERAREIGVPKDRILTTYFCRNCQSYSVKPYQLTDEEWAQHRIPIGNGQNKDCDICGAKGAQITTNVQFGVSEQQLNEIYNLMDVYLHAFTSGGQEIPVQESKLVEIPTLVTNYSCGTEYCLPENGGLALEWSEYREPGTEFIKATTSVDSIAQRLQEVFDMTPEARKKMGEKGRRFILDGFTAEVIGERYSQLIDDAPYINAIGEKDAVQGSKKVKTKGVDFSFKEPPKNPNYNPPQISDDKEWLKALYENILNMTPTDEDSGLVYWLKEINRGRDRESILRYFKKVALEENAKNNKVQLADHLSKNKNPKVLFVLRQSLGDAFICTSLFESIKRRYPDHDLYVATDPKFAEVFHCNPYVHEVLPYNDNMENELLMTGVGDHKGMFEVYLNPAVFTQRQLNYLSNSKLDVELNETN